MSTGAIIMMLVGCGAVWGGAIITIIVALTADKKSSFQDESNKVISQ